MSDLRSLCQMIRKVRYQEDAADPSWTAAAGRMFTVEAVGKHRFLRGECPRCKHKMEFTWSPDVHLGRKARVSSPIIPVLCQCEETHPKAPDGAKGCGALWEIDA